VEPQGPSGLERFVAVSTPPAPAERMSVAVVVERRRTGHRWQPVSWSVVDVLPGSPAAAEPWTPLARGEGWERYYAGTVQLELFRSETSAYRDNLAGARPAVYVILRRDEGGDGERPFALHGATVDPGEIESHSDSGDDLIEAVPLPPAVAAWMRDFVARHHVEQPFHKRRRDRADPEALSPRRRGARPTPPPGPPPGGEDDD
jgi:hypothetical protein